MFSFHKPKIYRSLKGCCICRAKSSSSRFTDSKKYENDFDQCFQIIEHRSGEICNACVLLVKRWKKLPKGSNRNWHHVVDARAGPGTKSIMKMKSKCKEEIRIKKKHKHKKVHRQIKPPQSPGGLSDDVVVGDDYHSDHSSHRSCSSSPSDVSDDEGHRRNMHKDVSVGRRKKTKPVRFSSFLDLTYWKKTEICCGIIFKGINGEVLVDTNLLRKCRTCKPANSELVSPVQTRPASLPEEDAEEEEIEEEEEEIEEEDNMEEDVTMDTVSSSSSQESSLSSFVDATNTCLAAEAVLDLSLPRHKVAGIPTRSPLCIEMEV